MAYEFLCQIDNKTDEKMAGRARFGGLINGILFDNGGLIRVVVWTSSKICLIVATILAWQIRNVTSMTVCTRTLKSFTTAQVCMGKFICTIDLGARTPGF